MHLNFEILVLNQAHIRKFKGFAGGDEDEEAKATAQKFLDGITP
jgi:hypothetical protein